MYFLCTKESILLWIHLLLRKDFFFVKHLRHLNGIVGYYFVWNQSKNKKFLTLIFGWQGVLGCARISPHMVKSSFHAVTVGINVIVISGPANLCVIGIALVSDIHLYVFVHIYKFTQVVDSNAVLTWLGTVSTAQSCKGHTRSNETYTCFKAV